ncbi:transposase [Mesorhizobium sp. M0322]|uniref:transposase n=1 Tax=Mesorhizobium sp. M0322 TaxID=2956937 RepID=UPI00333E0AC8
MPDDRIFHVLEAVLNRLEASPQRARRRWSAEAKSRLIEATLKPGANVSVIARQAGMAPAQLFGWRSKATRAVRSRRREMRFGLTLSRSQASSSKVEICLGEGVIPAGADVSQDHLAKIIRAVRQA